MLRLTAAEFGVRPIIIQLLPLICFIINWAVNENKRIGKPLSLKQSEKHC